MDEIEIKKHNFELAKNRVKEFSEQTEAALTIDMVQTEGGFLGLGDHKVTGYELNSRLEKIQNNFLTVNRINNKVIKEFREVYNVIDVLDKEYITSIVANMKGIAKNHKDLKEQQGILKKHNEELKSQQGRLNEHQADIEKNIANISKIVTVLKSFKEKLEDYRHLTDIDKMWDDYRNIQNELRVVLDSVAKVSNKAAEDFETLNDKNEALSEQLNKKNFDIQNEVKIVKEFYCDLDEKLGHTAKLLETQIPVLQESASFTDHLKTITHIDDIDSMWVDIGICKTKVEKIGENIQIQQNELDVISATSAEQADKLNRLEQANGKIHEIVDLNVHNISTLEEYMDKLKGIAHLDDIDSLWELVGEHGSKFDECEKREESLIVVIQKNKEEVKGNITEARDEVNVAIEALTKKIKYAYWIAGGSVGIAIVEFILFFMKVI